MNTKAKAVADKIRAWVGNMSGSAFYELLALAAEVEALPEWPVKLPPWSLADYRTYSNHLTSFGYGSTADFLDRIRNHLEGQQKATERETLRGEIEALKGEFAKRIGELEKLVQHG